MPRKKAAAGVAPASAEEAPAPTGSKPSKSETCPSCSQRLVKVGSIKSTGEDVYLCHSERKAFRGAEPLIASSRTNHPNLYDAIDLRDETTLNIEDIVLG